MDLKHVDLNLLVALRALLDEGSVTRAAQRMNVTQSAMSQTLARLREVFDDPLFVRQGRSMEPTHLARELDLPLSRTLAEIRSVFLRRPSFDPSQATRHFTVATTDYVGSVVLPDLLKHLSASAPGLTLSLQHIDIQHVARDLDQGLFDLAMSVIPDEVGIERAVLFSERFVTLARSGHPWLDDPSPEGMCQYGHVVMSPYGGGRGALDVGLEALGLSRTIALRLPGFSMGPGILAGTDLLMTLPARFATRFGRAFGLVTVETPVPMPQFDISVAWSTRNSHDPALVWLRQSVIDAVNPNPP